VKAYIASGFFCDKSLVEVESIKAVLKAHGFDVYSPKDAVKLTDDNADFVFNENLDNIASSDLVVVNTSIGASGKPDTGALFEAGFAYAQVVTIVYLWLDEGAEDKGFNLMLAQSGAAVFYSIAEFDAWLNVGDPVKYTGVIE
jgi:nucleoside 2-deoxyribosyltransferase